ncbi:acyltransferase family protein [Flavobacterium ardleyense]|uniref:acyltransferase family protein n=1 Tax=Flavobacterium ardleyense TaxID=2038737 RepID=UPI00298C497D|nr:acyltransferase [Flavobacterium ardleyense]
MTKQIYPALTGVRALAAYMVFIVHYNSIDETNFEILKKFVGQFHIGVSIFFVLSGFLIAYRYMDSKNFHFGRYMINRIARVYPIYFILTTITFLATWYYRQEESFDWVLYGMNITFLRGFFDDLIFTGIAQGWSLTVEETFYFTAPLLFLLLRKSKCFLVILPILILLIGFGIVHFFGNSLPFGFFGSNNFLLEFTFLGRVFEFFIGIGIVFVMKKSHLFSTSGWFTYGGISAMIICIYLMSILDNDGAAADKIPFYVVYLLFLPLLGIAPLLFGLIQEKTIVQSLFSNKVAVLLGKSSYAFYLVHMGIFKFKLDTITDNLWVIFLVLNLLAVVIYLFLEKPLNRIIRARFT